MARAAQDETPDTNDRIAAVLEQLAANAPVQEIGFGHPKYQERIKAEGFMDAFEKPVYQNGKEAQARGLKPETIDRAPKLRAGKYLGGKVEVARDQRDRVHLLYAHAKVEDRMRFQAIVRDFDDLVEKIWSEMSVS
jgi:hypothetical protein